MNDCINFDVLRIVYNETSMLTSLAESIDGISIEERHLGTRSYRCLGTQSRLIDVGHNKETVAKVAIVKPSFVTFAGFTVSNSKFIPGISPPFYSFLLSSHRNQPRSIELYIAGWVNV